MSERIRLTSEERARARLLSAISGDDERTCARALRFGVDSIRYHEPRERLRQAIADLQAAQDAASAVPAAHR